MDISWDLQALRARLSELPQELASMIENGDNASCLEAISRTFLDRRYTDTIITTCEPILAHCCAQIQSLGSPVSVLAAYGRILPIAPYLAEYAEKYLSSGTTFFQARKNHVDEELEYLLALYRLLQLDHHTFAKYIRHSEIEAFFEHSHGAVRCLAMRVLCSYHHAADAAMQRMYARLLPQDDATGVWETKEIHYKYLTLWEEQRQKEIRRDIKFARTARAQHDTAKAGILNQLDFDPSTTLIGGILLPSSAPTSQSQLSLPDFVSTSTTDYNLRSVAQQLRSARPLLLTGLAGSGKTAIIRNVAARLHKLDSMVTLHLNEQSDAKTLIGMYTTDATPGSFTWQPGVLTKAVLEGRWILIEDIDRAPNEVISTLLPLIERRQLRIPGRDQTVKAASGFKIIATLRTAIGQRGQEIDTSTSMLGARHWNSVHIKTPATDELHGIIVGLYPSLREYVPTLVRVYQEVQYITKQSVFGSRSKTGIMRSISPRDLLKWSARVDRLVIKTPIKGSQHDDQMFLDAVDCFAGSLAAGSAYDTVTACIAQHLQIDPQRMAHLLSSRVVNYSVNERHLVLGHHQFLRHNQNRLASARQGAFSTNAHTLRFLERIGVAVASKEPLLLVGETGTGKTTSVQYLANQLGKKLVAFNLSQQSESGDLLGGFKPVNMRSLMVPLKDEFDELFGVSFPPKVVLRNQPYLDLLGKCMAKGQWLRLCKLWNTALGMVEELRLAMLSLGSSSPVQNGDNPHKKRRIERSLTADVNARWDKFAQEFRNIERRLLAGSDSAFAFSFVEGNIVKAVRNGDWILLDEMNLATPDTLEALADLFDTAPSIMLTESGTLERIEAHPDFRVFAAMNPATDVGKKDLPPGIRSRFTELYVESPDRDLQSLRSIVQAYLGANEGALVSDVSNLHQAIQELAHRDLLVDGAGQKPHFSLRTLTRALTFAKDAMSQCSLRRAMYEGFQMSFLTMLDNESEARLVSLIQKHLFGAHPKVLAEVKQPMRRPGNDRHKYTLEGRFWLREGPFPIEDQSHYIITDFIRRNLDNLIRATSTRRFPVLLQGPTSSGKTSMVEYLAKRSGNKFVRINNHEHTDLQEYLGAYVSGADGKLQFQEGILVQALRQGHWIVLDELNLAPTDVLEALNRLLDDNRELLIPETQEVVRPHDNFMLFATQNPAGLYGGRKVLSRAFRNRFLELHFDDIPIDELHIILHQRTQIPSSWSQRIVSVYKELAMLRQENRLFENKSFATLRDLFRWALRPAETIQHLAVNGYMLLGERVRKPEERLAIKQIIEKVLSQRGPKVTIDESILYGEVSLQLSPSAREDLEAQGTVWTGAMRRLYVLAMQAIRNNEPVLLVGETGCGKTTVCQMLARAFGKELFIVNAHQNTETGDLIGAQRPARNRAAMEEQLRTEMLGLPDAELHAVIENMDLENALRYYDAWKASFVNESPDGLPIHGFEAIEQLRIRLKTLFEWSDGSLVHAMKAGQYFLLDEISLADDSVLERLNSVLEPQRSLLLAEKGSLDSFVVAQTDFSFFATMNPGGDYGKKELSPALRNRFTEIWVPSLSNVEDVLQIVKAKLKSPLLCEIVVAFAQWFHVRYNQTASGSISIRDTLSWVEFINRFPEQPLLGLVHGAAMVYIDSLGANPAALLAITSAKIDEERTHCIAELGRLAKADTAAIYSARIEHVVNAASLILGSFQIPRVGVASTDPEFTLAAPTTRANAMRIVRALQLTKPVLIEGNPGVGKTTLVTALSKLVGVPLTRINLSEQTDLMDLFGSDIPVEHAVAGTFAWRDAPFLRAMKSGEWVLLDEMNLASQSILEGLNACLDHRGEVYISELDQTFSRHPDFRLFAAQNPHHQGGGRKGLPASFVNRFTVVYADVFTHQDLLTICTNAFPSANADRLASTMDFIERLDIETSNRRLGVVGGPWEFNLRDALRWLSLVTSKQGLLAAGGHFDFLHMIITQRFRTVKDRFMVNSLYCCSFNDTPDAHSLFHNLSEAFFQVGMGLLPRNKLIVPFGNDFSTKYDFRTQLPVLESIMISVQQRWPVILVGPSGSGKSLLLERLATIVGAELVTFSLNADIDSMDLVGGYEQSDPQRQTARFHREVQQLAHKALICINSGDFSEHGMGFSYLLETIIKSLNFSEVSDAQGSPSLRQMLSELLDAGFAEASDLIDQLDDLPLQIKVIERAQFEWVDGVLVQAMQRGDWLVLDNANLCSSAVLDRLNSLLEPNGCLIINEHTDSTGHPHIIKPHANFRIFLAMDPKYGELSRALRNRAVEVCLLPSDSVTEQDRGSSVLSLSTESELYRLSNLQLLSPCKDTSFNPSLMTDLASDHLSQSDLVSLPVFASQIDAGLLDVERKDTISSLQKVHRLEGKEQGERVVSARTWVDREQSLSLLQTIHPLNNDILLRSCENNAEMIRWFGRVFDTIWDLTGMRDTLTSVAEASGPQRSLTRLQRSARGNSIPKASRDSTFGVYPFLTNIASMLADLANSASQASARSIDPTVVDFLPSLRRFWWELATLTNSSGFDEASFQVFLQVARSLISPLHATGRSPAAWEKSLVTQIDDLGPASKLTNATTMSALWGALRPETPRTFAQLQTIIALEGLADRFDSQTWSLQASIDDLLVLRKSFSDSLTIARSSADSSDLLQMLQDAMFGIAVNDEVHGAQPHFTEQFETISQTFDLFEVVSDIRDLSFVSQVPAASLLAGRRIKNMNLKDSSIPTGLTPIRVIQLLSTYIGSESKDFQSRALEQDLCASVAFRIRDSDNVGLGHLDLLQYEMKTLSAILARGADTLAHSHVPILNSALKGLLLHVSGVLTTSTTDPEIKESIMNLTNAIATGVALPLSSSMSATKNLGDSQIAAIQSTFFCHCATAINTVSDQHNQAHISDITGSANAWIGFALGCIQLYVPNQVFDPALKPLIQRDMFRREKGDMETRLSALRQFELRFTGQDSTLRTKLLEEDLSRLGSEPPVEEIARPPKSEMVQLQGEFDALLRTLSPLLQLEFSELASKAHDPLLRANINQLKKRLREGYRAYDDITTPLVGFLDCLELGFALATLTKSRSTQSESPFDLVRYSTPMLGARPDVWAITSRLETVKSCPLRVQLYALSSLASMRKLMPEDHVTEQAWLPIHDVFDDTYQRWRTELQTKQQENAANTSLYRYLGGEDVEDEAADDEFNELFAEQDESEGQTSEHKQPAPALHYMASQLSDTLCAMISTNKSSSNEILSLMDQVESLLTKESEISALDKSNNDSELMPFLMRMLARKADVLQGGLQNAKSYNIYTDPNVTEAQRLIAMIKRVQARFRSIQQVWPEHATLAEVLRTCDELLYFKHTEVVAKYLTKLEKLHEYVHEWQKVASSEYSAAAIYDSITDMLVSWRQLELSTWSRLLDMEVTKCNDDAKSWFFIAYENVVVVPLGIGSSKQEMKLHVVELLRTLESFFLSTGLGQYSERLRMLSALQQYLKIRSAVSPPLRLVSDALKNFISYMERFEKPVADAIIKGRQILEKKVKEIIQLASWKDRTIDALRQSAKASHRKLFKVIRKFRALLGQPAEGIIRAGVLEGSLATTVNTTLLAQIAASVSTESRALCEERLANWNSAPARFRNTAVTLSVMQSMTQGPPDGLDGSIEVNSWLVDVGELMTELRKLTPAMLTEENKETVQHLKTRKRTLFADVLKELRNMGFKSSLGTDALARQDSLAVVLAILPTLDTSDKISLRTAQAHLQQLVQIMPQVREAAREHSDDLTGAEVSRSISLLESMLQTVIEQRTALHASQSGQQSMHDALQKMQGLVGSTSISLQDVQDNNAYGLKAAVYCLPTILDASAEILNSQMRVGNLEGDSVAHKLSDLAKKVEEKRWDWKSQMALPDQITNSERKNLQEEATLLINELRDHLQSAGKAHPYFEPTLNQVMLWTEYGVSQLPMTGRAESFLELESFSQDVFSFVDLVLGSMEDLRKALASSPTSIEQPQWLLQEGVTLTAASKSLRTQLVSSRLEHLLGQLRLLEDSPDSLPVASALLSNFLPIVRQYNATADYVAGKFADLHQSLCHMSSSLAQTFVKLAREGFCTPSEKSSGKDDQSDKVEGGTGLGDGEGGEDISKDVQDDEDLTELAQEPNQKNDREEIEDEKDAVDMADEDLEGEMGDAEEKGEDEDGASESEGEDQDMDEEAGDVDDLGPSTVDEKMWDDGGKDADKDKEADKADGTMDKDNVAAAEGEEKDKADESPEEGGDEAPEEEVGAEESEDVNREETEKADPHMQEQDNLDLPDDIDMDGQKDEGDESDLEDMDGDEIAQDVMEEDQKEIADEREDKDADGDEVDEGTPDISEAGDEDQDVQQPEEGNDDEADRTQDAGEDAEDEPAEDDSVLQNDRPDDSKAADEVAPSEAQGTGLSDLQMQEEQKQQDAGAAEQEQGTEGASDQRQQTAGSQGQRGRANEDQAAAGPDENDEQDQESSPFKKLGDALEKWYRQHQQIADAQKQDVEQKQNQDTDMTDVEFEHLPDEAAEADAQALGAASEDQAKAIDEDAGVSTNDKKTHEYFPPEERDQDAQDGQDVDMQDLPSPDDKNQEGTEGVPNAFVGDYREQPLDLSLPDQPAQEENQDMSDMDANLPLPDLAAPNSPSPLDDTDADTALTKWTDHESQIRNLALTLTEHLRLILSPTQATKMRGDFRTGKRLNIKRIIPYIASSYKRDKIWMRRSVPSKRNYQIMLAVDDSQSMRESGSSELAYSTLALVSKSLSMLEAGELCVVGFGQDVTVAHEFGTPFTSQAGAEVVRKLQFEQTQTDVARLLERSLDVFANARVKATSSASELWQLMFVVSDGVCKDHAGIRRLVRQAQEARIMIVFVIVDAVAGVKEGGSSILDLQTARFGKDDKGNMTVDTVKYLETFPFRYYLVVRDVEELPGVLANALRQWFSEVVETGGQ